MNIRVILGSLLILLGIYFFVNEGMSFGPETIFTYFWPTIFIIPLGIFFHWLYFSVTDRKATGVLIPGGILLTVGIVCQISMLFDLWEYMWPGFILAVAVGLFEFYLFGDRNKYLLIPINILTVLSMLFFIVFSVGTLFGHIVAQPIIAIVMILIGLWALLGKKSSV